MISHPTQPFSTGKALIFTLGITTLVMIIEFVYGWLSGSLALISDAIHMASHSMSTIITLAAYLISKRSTTLEKSYGFYRSEVLAALLNGGLLIPAGVWIIYESCIRYFNPIPIQSTEMLVVAMIGLITNAITLWILHIPARKNLNMKSLVYHVLGDLLSSVAVVIAALCIYYKSWTWVDPTISALIAILILVWGISTILESTHILMESSPKHINHDEVRSAIQEKIPGCTAVHDLHIWEITQNQIMLTAHVVTHEQMIGQIQSHINKVNQYLKEKFGIAHTTLQYEVDECDHRHN